VKRLAIITIIACVTAIAASAEAGQTPSRQELEQQIPTDIAWVLRVDGHTDVDPINTPQFQSNWELSAARAIAVVKALIEQGIPPNRLVAAGFGEFQPIDPSDTDEAKAKILGGNAARLHGIEVDAIPCPFDRADLQVMREELAAPHLTFGPTDSGEIALHLASHGAL